MKPIEEILKDTRLESVEQEPFENFLVKGYLRLRSGKQRTFTVFASVDNSSEYGFGEHVSVSLYNESRKTPTWEEMCEVKEIFWKPEEEVHQIHPPESRYVHGIFGKDNILHLWRPVKNGWLGEPRERRIDNRPSEVGRKTDPEEDDMIYNPYTGSFFRR